MTPFEHTYTQIPYVSRAGNHPADVQPLQPQAGRRLLDGRADRRQRAGCQVRLQQRREVLQLGLHAQGHPRRARAGGHELLHRPGGRPADDHQGHDVLPRGRLAAGPGQGLQAVAASSSTRGTTPSTTAKASSAAARCTTPTRSTSGAAWASRPSRSTATSRTTATTSRTARTWLTISAKETIRHRWIKELNEEAAKAGKPVDRRGRRQHPLADRGVLQHAHAAADRRLPRLARSSASATPAATSSASLQILEEAGIACHWYFNYTDGYRPRVEKQLARLPSARTRTARPSPPAGTCATT